MRLHVHRWRVQFRPIWDSQGGYVDCRCGAREVRGGDGYAYTAWPWIRYGTAPPPSYLAEIGYRPAQTGRMGA